jgi:hypothetical protein
VASAEAVSAARADLAFAQGMSLRIDARAPHRAIEVIPALGGSGTVTWSRNDNTLRPSVSQPARGSGFASTASTAEVVLSTRANRAFQLHADEGDLSIRLLGATDAIASLEGGYAVYARALGDATLIHRPLREGTEDFLLFREKPKTESLSYEVDVTGIAGVRAVAGSDTVEFLDRTGNPVYRMNAPWAADADGRRIEAHTSVTGCTYDASPAAPWGRAVTTPGSTTCMIHVSWSATRYPLLVDPTWMRTGNPTRVRGWVSSSGPVTALLPSGRVLIAGGTSATYSTSFKDAEIFNPSTNTFAATGSMAIERGDAATATVLNNGRVLVAGGGAPPAIWGAPTNTTELYDEGTGMFAAGPVMAVPRVRHRAMPLGNGKVLFVGGGSNLAPSAVAELLDLAAGTFSPAPAYPGGAHLDASAIGVAGGKVLVAGGFPSNNQAHLYDIATNTWSAAAGTLPGQVRLCAKPFLKSNGDVILFGGYNTAGSAILTPLQWTAPSTWQTLGARPGTEFMCDVIGNATAVTVGAVTTTLGGVPSAPFEFDPVSGNVTAAGTFVGFGHSNLVALRDGRLLAIGGAEAGNANIAVADITMGTPVPDAGPDARDAAVAADAGTSSSSSSGSSGTSSSSSSSSSGSSSGSDAAVGPVVEDGPGGVEGGGFNCASQPGGSNFSAAAGAALMTVTLAWLRRKNKKHN